MLVASIFIFRGQDAEALRLQEQLARLQQEEYAESLRGDRLRDQIQMSETSGFREREARRRFGYVRQGVTRYVADTPSMDYTDEEPPTTPLDTAKTVSSDWASFGN